MVALVYMVCYGAAYFHPLPYREDAVTALDAVLALFPPLDDGSDPQVWLDRLYLRERRNILQAVRDALASGSTTPIGPYSVMEVNAALQRTIGMLRNRVSA